MNQEALHDYYHNSETGQYAFYHLLKTLFTSDLYLCQDNTKILYGLMIEHRGLSLKNGWLDERNSILGLGGM